VPNRLTKETSPYLLQHSNNPVDWYPWGDEALAHAKTQDKPILLSIGYSACHWCHVMAHESFENEEVARLMNDNFVNIKVDREERPDLDTIYMDAVQSITGRGGWPLIVFLTPEGKPFYGGTYFPPEDRHGLPGFSRVLETVSDAYQNRRKEIEQATQQVMTALNSGVEGGSNAQQLDADILNQAYSTIGQDYDEVNGGFGHAPKFPQPMVLDFLLRQYHRDGDEKALDMVTLTLESMAKGGVYDQLGGGFHRYATDAKWMVPHFEKMLYDNAQLSQVYLHAYLITEKPLFRRIAEETIDYVLREMTSAEGGFYNTQDADSESEEGKYYTWTIDEIKEVLDEKPANILGEYYGVTTSGNFEGRNILHIARDSYSEEPENIKRAKVLLLIEREKRTQPGRDEKILASWNGLMLASLAEAALIVNREEYLNAAIANGQFLLESLISDGYLRHTYKDGKASIEGYLEDYASVIEGLLNLHQATFKSKWLNEAIRLADVMVDEFWDESAVLFFDTGKRHQALFIRPRNTHDGALPSGSSLATSVLLKLSRLINNKSFERIAVSSLTTMGRIISQFPQVFGNWLCALDFHLSTPQEIAIVGSRNNPMTADLLRVLYSTWLPNKVVAAKDPGDSFPVDNLVILKDRYMINDMPTVYVCERYSCRAPVIDPELLHQQLFRA
jgi:uncharacterized protein YyaL (SSP411 family)